jgi:hypothetical protein
MKLTKLRCLQSQRCYSSTEKSSHRLGSGNLARNRLFNCQERDTVKPCNSTWQSFSFRIQDLHGGIVVVDDISLGGLTDQFPVGGLKAFVGGVL